MYYRYAVHVFLYTLTSALVIILGMIYVHDPYMVFHRKWFSPETMSSNMRIQNYGIMKYEKFNAVIMGTSMLENTSAALASELLGKKFVNLSIEGASYYERMLAMNYLFKHQKIKHVITSLDFIYNKYNTVNNTFQESLYRDDTLVDRFSVYLNDQSFWCALFGYKCSMRPKNLDMPKSWANFDVWRRRFGGFENWFVKDHLERKKRKRPNISEDTIKDYRKVIDEEIIPLFEHRDVHFDVVIPPYSILWWAKYRNGFDIAQAPMEYFVNRVAEYDNVTVYWFYDDAYFTDIANYKDDEHYDSPMNVRQLESIKKKQNIITRENYSEKIRKLKRRVTSFDATYYLDRLYY